MTTGLGPMHVSPLPPGTIYMCTLPSRRGEVAGLLCDEQVCLLAVCCLAAVAHERPARWLRDLPRRDDAHSGCCMLHAA